MSRDIDEPSGDHQAEGPTHVDDSPHSTPNTETEDEDAVENEKVSPLGPSTLWRRLRNVFIIVFLIGLASLALRATSAKPKVIHAHRYSDEFRFRPAASPIITETLRDGRTRIRGAEPTQRSAPPGQKPNKKTGKSKKGRKVKKSKTGAKARS